MSATLTHGNLSAAGKPLVMYVTGGGITALGEMTKFGGASKYLIEAVVNYSMESTHQVLGYKPKHYACAETARALAVKAYQRCYQLTGGNKQSIGLAATSKLAVPGEREGRQHEIHVAVHQYDSTVVYSHSPNNDRTVEEKTNQKIILEALNRAVNSPDWFFHDIVTIDKARYPFLEQNAYFQFRTTGTREWAHQPFTDPFIFPGSFNPIHKNHLEIASLVYFIYGKRTWFEISVNNTDKPSIDAIELRNRVNQIEATKSSYIEGVVVTDKMLFVDKAKEYRNATFVVGADTINRIYDPKYYHDHAQYLGRKELKFVVFPRKGSTLNPEILTNPNITVIPESVYLDDGTSSSSIRNAQ